MGLSVSGGSAIIFIGMVVVFGLMFGALDQYQQDMASSYQQIEETALRIRSTSIVILDLDVDNGTFTIMNDGQATIRTDSMDIILNGTLLDRAQFTFVIEGSEGSGLLLPGDVAEVHLNCEMTGRRIMIVTDLGVTATYTSG